MSASKPPADSEASHRGAGAVRLPPGLDEDTVRNFLRNEGRQWLRDTNIIGISVGEKRSGGVGVGVPAVRFDVIGKLADPAAIIRAGSRPIPEVIDVGGISLPTDVVEAWPQAHGSTAARRKSKLDPLIGGISVGSGTDTGTLGAILWHRPTGQRVGLSNWHVLANDPDGTSVFQPGLGDVGGRRHPIGRLQDKELSFDLDAAITTIQGRNVRDEIAGLGVAVSGVRKPALNMRVVKSGKETDVTFGRISDPNKLTSFQILGRPAWHDIMVFAIEPDPGSPPPDGDLSREGDSGSCWMFVEEDGRITGDMVGLHVAGDASLGLAYACHADKVFERFDLEPLGNRALSPAPPPAPGSAGPVLHRVTARDGLLIRTGPGREFPDKGGLAFGTEVSVIARHGDWLAVDLQGDGAADGFMHGSLLKPIDPS